jgi:lauroyl/myristoyl acyltransferase
VRRWLGPLHVTGVLWYRLHRFGAASTPRWIPPLFLPLFTIFFYLALRRIGKAIATNLVPVLGPCGWWERQRRLYRTFRAFAWSQTERYERLGTSRRFDWRIDGEDHWRRLMESPRGFMLLTAHIGNWEVGSMLPAERTGKQIHVVREGELDPRAQEFTRALLAGREGLPYTTHFVTGEASLSLELLDALRRGDIVALQGDRPRAGGRSVEVSLFGRGAPFPIGPAVLARAAEVPLVPVFVFREGRRRYRIRIRPPIEAARTQDRDQDVADAVKRIAREVEGAIRQAPHQWFCFAPIWSGGGV